MEEIIKHINDTNASYRNPKAGDAKNTDLFLDSEHYELFQEYGEQITVRYSKENLTKAILFIASVLPRKYDNSSIHKIIPFSKEFVLDELDFLDAYFTIDGFTVDSKTQKWNARKDVIQKNGKIDNRFYFNELIDNFIYKKKDGTIQKAKFTIRNYLAGGYSDLHIKKNNDGIFDVWITNVLTPYNDGKENESVIEQRIINTNIPFQLIFYGAPGTGKSHTINETTEKQPKGNVFRTTFHPDSDYSTFVGCYKPSMANNEPLYEIGELINKLSEIKTSGVTYPCHKFAAKYWESLKDLSSDEIKKILTDCGFTETMNVEISKGIAVGEDLAKKADNKKIVYSFVPQSFTKAYLRAWQTEEPVYLVIEEINRGNCAQIFGDLFQLLDRKEGMSEYPIKTDSDLGKYISGILTNSTRTDIPDSVIKGEELILPANLYIWATMNTSDQSLFPIDSAFKRRWDWKYIPISDAKKNYVIEVDGEQYDWWSFLEIINGIIEDTTRSEDKKLGYFFAKANDGRITTDTFVNKVVFYLWNDVFKDNESEHKAFKDENGNMLAFHEFFHQDGSINTDTVIKFLLDLEVDPFEDTNKSTDQPNNTIPNAKRARDKSRYRVNTTDNLNKAQMTREAFKYYIESHPDSDAQAIAQAWNGLGLKGIVQHLVETESEFLERTKDSQDSNKRAVEFILANDEKIYLSTQFGIGNIDKFIDAINNASWNIRIDKTA